MKLSGVLNAFGVVLIVCLVVFLIIAMNEESMNAVVVVAVSVSSLWTCLVLFALAKLLQKANE